MMFSAFFKKYFSVEPVVYGKSKISELIKEFIRENSSIGDYDWDDFTSAELSDPSEAFIQRLVYFIDVHFPARHRHEWCNDEGGKALSRLAEAIDSDSLPLPPTEDELITFKKGQIPFRYKDIILGKENMNPRER